MKLKCSIIKIKEALLAVEKITGKNLTLPVLSSILWVAKDKKLQLKATNLSLGIEVEIPAKIEKEGVVAIKGDILSSLFSVLQGDSDVYFELINENLSVKTKQNTILIKSIPHEDFPSIPKVKGDSFNISSKKLIEGIKSVYYSAAISDIKPEIGSIYIYPEENNLVFVATDSFRLAEKKIKIKKDLSFEDILIPFKNASEIIRLFDNKSDEIEITLEKNKISFSVDNTYLTSRVVDGVFPDYNQIIPKNIKTQAVVLKQDFINALKVANIFSDKFNQVTISIKPEEKMFEVETRNLELGENNTFISGALKGEDIITSFNY
ncbi:MAG: DNA polymerase III subunit beta, partial [Patescibacteria group bacterium]|nr:DNA polymerase III subunit beta [Patescibacteria group bacterium]